MPVSNHGKAKSSFNYQWNSKSTLPHVAAEGLSVFMLETSAQKKICRRTQVWQQKRSKTVWNVKMKMFLSFKMILSL